MFRPLLGHHQVVLNLQSNCTVQSKYPIVDEITFTMIRYMNSINRMLPIFAIHVPYSNLSMVSMTSTGCIYYDTIDRLEYGTWIANIGNILLIEFMYLIIVKVISSTIGYIDCTVQLPCKLSTT